MCLKLLGTHIILLCLKLLGTVFKFHYHGLCFDSVQNHEGFEPEPLFMVGFSMDLICRAKASVHGKI